MTIGERLRQLRDLSRPRRTQEQVGESLGHNQRWISEREQGKVDTSVMDAIEIAEALGFAAELVIVPRANADLLGSVAELEPDGAAIALRLARVWPLIDPGTRATLDAVIRVAEERVESEMRARGV